MGRGELLGSREIDQVFQEKVMIIITKPRNTPYKHNVKTPYKFCLFSNDNHINMKKEYTRKMYILVSSIIFYLKAFECKLLATLSHLKKTIDQIHYSQFAKTENNVGKTGHWMRS